jgi:hypothetical protein
MTMTKEDLYAEAKRLNIPGRSKMTKPELEAAINELNSVDLSPEAAHRPIDIAFMGNKRERHAARMAKRRTSAVNKFTPNRITRMVRASQSRRYGMGGRGMGAKHYGYGIGSYNVMGYPNPGTHPDAFKMLSYGDRVRHYTKQTGQPLATVEGFPGPVLTARQWRRIDKKDNRNKFRARPTKEARYV